MMKKEKVWLVTGASKGFGFEITKAILESGDKVIATVRKDPEKLMSSLNNNPNLLVVEMDVTDQKQVDEAVAKGLARFKRLDVVVNNAGFGILGAIEEISNEEAKKQYDTNVFGVLNVIRASLPQMRKQKSGHIINFSSLFGYDTIPGYALYGTTKFAVEGISNGLAKEVAAFGIKVTALAPGLFRTNFLDAGSYIKAKNNIKDYDNTIVGEMKSSPEQLHGNQAGAPAKLGKVVVELGNLDNPPLHLPVGLDSLASFRKGFAETSRDIEDWVGKFTATEV